MEPTASRRTVQLCMSSFCQPQPRTFSPAAARLVLVRPCERHPRLSRPHRRSWLRDFRRVALRLGGVLASQLVQFESPLCRTDRGSYRNRFLASHTGGYVVFSTMGAVHLCCPSCGCTAHEPVPRASLFSIVAAFVRCPSGRTYAALNRCHSRDVLSAASARLFRQEEGLTNCRSGSDN